MNNKEILIETVKDSLGNDIKKGDILVGFGRGGNYRNVLRYIVVKEIKEVRFKGYNRIPDMRKMCLFGKGFRIITDKRTSEQPVYDISYLLDSRRGMIKNPENTMIIKNKETLNQIKDIITDLQIEEFAGG